MTPLGTLDLECPECGRTMHVPIVCIAWPLNGRELRLDYDPAYIAAHVATHGPGGGETVGAAA